MQLLALILWFASLGFLPSQVSLSAYPSASWAGGDSAGSSSSLRLTSFTANQLNQYIDITSLASLDVIGAAYATATVSINGDPGAHRRGEYFHKALHFNNSNGPISCVVTSAATLGPNSSPVLLRTNLFPPYIQSPGQTNLFHDLDGNLVRDGLWHYRWDGENRLVEMTNVAGLANDLRRKLVFDYDSDDRRIRKRVFAWSGSNWAGTPLVDNKFVYDRWWLLSELNATNNAPLRSYTWGADLSGGFQEAGGWTSQVLQFRCPMRDVRFANRSGGLLMVVDHVGGSTNYTAFDGNGNIMGLVQGNGAVSAQYEYGPFGENIRASGPLAGVNPFKWSTKFQDRETGLSYYGYRYYSAELGRWLNRDPIEEKGGLNLLAILGNNSVNWIDALGTHKQDNRYGLPDDFWEWYHRSPYYVKREFKQRRCREFSERMDERR